MSGPAPRPRPLPRPPQLIAWLLSAWRAPGRRRAVIAAYQALKAQPLVLADIALRGSVYAPSGAQDAIGLARAEGRRELALEIIKCAGADPALILRLVETYEMREPT